MTIYDSQLAANRTNAAASTGPRTPEGARAAAQIHFEDAEDENLYRTVWARLVAALKPTNMVESTHVERLALLHESAERPDPSRGAPPSSEATTVPLAAVPPSPAVPPPAPQPATPLVSRPSTPSSYPQGSSQTPTSWDDAIRALLSGSTPVVRGDSSPPGSGARPGCNQGRGTVLPNEPIPTPERERSP